MRSCRFVERLALAVKGLSAERIALILAVGLVLGTFPVFGCPTVLCLAAAVFLKVNLPALQLVNQLSSPLQWLLLLPLERAGSRILAFPAVTTTHIGALAIHAVAGWFFICVPLGFVLYLTLMLLLRRRLAV